MLSGCDLWHILETRIDAGLLLVVSLLLRFPSFLCLFHRVDLVGIAPEQPGGYRELIEWQGSEAYKLLGITGF